MKKFWIIIIGSLLLVSLEPEKASAFIYELARKITNHEFNIEGTVEEAVSTFIGFQEVFRTPDHEPPIEEDDVRNALRYRPDLVCKKRNQRNPCNITQPVRDIARRESYSRVVGQDLYLTAIANEIVLTDHTGQDITISPRLPSIIRMWQSSFDWMFTPVTERRIKSHGLPPKEDEVFWEIISGKKDPKTGKRSGGLTSSITLPQDPIRYRWGFQTVIREDLSLADCESWQRAWDEEIYDGSELILLKKRNCVLEKKMQQAITHLRNVLEYEIKNGEVVIYPIIDFGFAFVWFRLDEDPAKDDAGLDVKRPTSNMFLPKLTCKWKDDPDVIVPACVHGVDGDVILGGMYPEPPLEPPENEKLCSMVFSSHGYLCDPIESRECPKEEEEGEESSSITLTICKPGGIGTGTIVSLSEAGPDACRMGGWRLDEVTIGSEPVNDTPKRDLEEINKPYDCSNCSVDLYCDGAGVDGPYYEPEPPEDYDGKQNCKKEPATYPKEKDKGVIPICIPSIHLFNKYNIMHELIHAQQLCNLPPGQHIWEDVDSCCTREMQANFIICSVMTGDGLLEDTDISTEVCMGILSSHTCQHLVEEDAEGEDAIACIGTTLGDEEEVERFHNKIKRGVAPTAVTCHEAINHMDERTKTLLNSLRLVCDPECETKYVNTIGNNACYIAQCVEESLETQRILPGRMTEVAPAQTFPWDDETKNDPMIGSLMTYPPLPFSHFPKYRPALLAKELDLALCQLNGLPMKNPPHKCNFNISRQLSLKPEYPPLLGAGLIKQTSEQFTAAWSLQTLAPSIGSRIATRIYQNYFERSGRSFKEVIDSVNMLVGGIANIKFPSNMCPRYGDP